jgi:hypothetical protein
MGAFTYGGKFEQHINHLYSRENVAETANKFKEHEKQHGSYSFGDKFTKALVPKAEHWASESGSTEGFNKWEKNSGEIPEPIRKKITDVISTNLRSDHPLPLVLKFAHKGHMHIGLHILCPNSSLK